MAALEDEEGPDEALVGELAQIIERRWQARSITTKAGTVTLSPLVFHRGEGRPGTVQPVGTFDKALRTACQAAGIPYGRKTGRTFHCLRRSCARDLRRAGVEEAVAMQITGHLTSSMFRRYSITNERDIAEAMLKRQAHVEAQFPASNVMALPTGSRG